jgi:hypothetical protein
MAYSAGQPPLHWQFSQTQLGSKLVPFVYGSNTPEAPRYKQQPPSKTKPGWVNPDIPYKAIDNNDYRKRLADALMGK